MSDENVEIATRVFKQISEGGFDAAWEHLDPDRNEALEAVGLSE